MIPLTRLNGVALHLNADLVATVEEHHDTVVTLVDGKCLPVAESAAQVVAAVMHYRAQIRAMSERMLREPTSAPARSERASGAEATVVALRPGQGE